MDVDIQTFGPETTKRLVEIANKRPSTSDNGKTARNPMPEFQFRARNVFVNNSGETVPPFALMRVTGLQSQNDRYVVEIARPDGSESPCLVNGPREVADGARGSYQDASNHFVLLTDETSGSVGPGNDWPAVPGSVFRILGQIEPGQALVQLEKSNSETNPTDPEDPASNNDCCEFGQLFICPLPEGIDYEVLCSAIDPPIDGEKMYKVRFFAVDTSGVEILPDDESSSSEILEHRELLTLPCTEEVCKEVDLSGVTINGVVLGEVTYGNQEGCCDRQRLVVTWGTVNDNDPFEPPAIIQEGPSTAWTHTAMIEANNGGVLEVAIDAELIGLPERLPPNIGNIDRDFTIRSTLNSNPPPLDQEIVGDGVLLGTGIGGLPTTNITATLLTDENGDYSGEASVRFTNPLSGFENVAFFVRWSYVDDDDLPNAPS